MLQSKKNTGEGTVASQNAVHPEFANDSGKEGPIWVMHGSHFLFRSADPGRVSFFFFLEGIPPAWLL